MKSIIFAIAFTVVGMTATAVVLVWRRRRALRRFGHEIETYESERKRRWR